MRFLIGILVLATMACGGQPSAGTTQPQPDPPPLEQPEEMTGTFLSLTPDAKNSRVINMLYLDSDGRLRNEQFFADNMLVDYSRDDYAWRASFDGPLSQGDRFRMTSDKKRTRVITKLE